MAATLWRYRSIARASCAAIGALVALFAPVAGAQVYLTEGTNISVDVASDGRLAMDLLGDLWLLQAGGGEAQALVQGRSVVQRPRWSPDAESIVYQSNADGRTVLRLFDVAAAEDRSLGDARWANREPSWHPDGERVVFSSSRHATGIDLWEIDVPTGLSWRLSKLPGNETQPAWSADGRDLMYVHEHDGRWSIMMRRRGHADEAVVSADTRLAAPSWRPDGSLITYLRKDDDGWTLAMTILSEPRLDRPMIRGEDFFIAPVSWLDRQTLMYTANGGLRKRGFNAWSSSYVPFRANVGPGSRRDATATHDRDIETIDEPAGKHVIRVGRVFDGVDGRYRHNVDIVLDGGRIAAIEDQQSHDDAILIDLGDLTAIPGFVDARAPIGRSIAAADGPLLLSLGLTTFVAPLENAQQLNEQWSGKRFAGSAGRDARLGTAIRIRCHGVSRYSQHAAVAGRRQLSGRVVRRWYRNDYLVVGVGRRRHT